MKYALMGISAYIPNVIFPKRFDSIESAKDAAIYCKEVLGFLKVSIWKTEDCKTEPIGFLLIHRCYQF